MTGASQAKAETWRQVDGYPRYQVSDLGRVRSFQGGQPLIMALVADNYGYPTVSLRASGRRTRFKVHRLVCATFHGPQPVGCEVAHLDGSRTKARADNLKWCTPSENHSHKRLHGTDRSGENSTRAMMQQSIVQQILEMSAQGLSQVTIGGMLGVSATAVHRVRHGKTRAARKALEAAQ